MRINLSFVEGPQSSVATYVLSPYPTADLDNETSSLVCCICQEDVVQGQEALTTACPCTPDLRVGHSECFIASASYRANRHTLIMDCFSNAHPIHLGCYDDDVFPPVFFDAVSNLGDDESEAASTVSSESTDSLRSTASKLKKKETIWVLPPLEERQPPEEEDPYRLTKEVERQEMYDQFGEDDAPCFRTWKSRHVHEILDRFGEEHDDIARWKIRVMQNINHHFGGTPPDTDEDFGDIPIDFFIYEGAEEHQPSSQPEEVQPVAPHEEDYDDDACSTTAEYGGDDLDLSEWGLPVVPPEERGRFSVPEGIEVEVASS